LELLPILRGFNILKKTFSEMIIDDQLMLLALKEILVESGIIKHEDFKKKFNDLKDHYKKDKDFRKLLK